MSETSSASIFMEDYEQRLLESIRAAVAARITLRTDIRSFFLHSNELLSSIINGRICCSCHVQPDVCALSRVIGLPGTQWKNQLIEKDKWSAFINKLQLAADGDDLNFLNTECSKVVRTLLGNLGRASSAHQLRQVCQPSADPEGADEEEEEEEKKEEADEQVEQADEQEADDEVEEAHEQEAEEKKRKKRKRKRTKKQDTDAEEEAVEQESEKKKGGRGRGREQRNQTPMKKKKVMNK